MRREFVACEVLGPREPNAQRHRLTALSNGPTQLPTGPDGPNVADGSQERAQEDLNVRMTASVDQRGPGRTLFDRLREVSVLQEVRQVHLTIPGSPTEGEVQRDADAAGQFPRRVVEAWLDLGASARRGGTLLPPQEKPVVFRGRKSGCVT